MPLTFAHPAIVLPFPRNSKWFHFTALVLGSMAPDFEYFLRGEPHALIGHTFLGFFYFNLPLVVIVYFLYSRYVMDVLVQNLPLFLQDSYINQNKEKNLIGLFVFCYSALLGMLTHVVWDSFTHLNGYMVTKISLLSSQVTLFGYSFPAFKLLQHGGTLCGGMIIFLYLCYRGKLFHSSKPTSIAPKKKLFYWFLILFLTSLLVAGWSILFYVPITVYGTTVVRIIDSFFLSLLIVSIIFKKYINN